MNIIDQYIEKLMLGSTPDKPLWNIEAIHQGKPAVWNYVDGCMMSGLLQYQDKESKLFYQVIDQKDHMGNYLESSGSSLLAYAILKGVRLGALDSSYQQIGLDIFDGIVKKFIRMDNQSLNMDGICLVAGLGPDSNLRRDGIIEYYLSEPVVKNDAKGVGPFILAYTEVKKTSNR